MNELRKQIIIEEYEKITMKNVVEPVKFWALYATSLYEKLFQKINSVRQLEKTYNAMIPKMKRPDDKKALEFFYQLRKQELNGSFKWEQKMENKIRNIIREEIRSILSEKNIKTQKWRKVPDHEWRPAGLSNATVVKSGNHVTGYIDSKNVDSKKRNMVQIQLGSDSDNIILKPIKSSTDADNILFKIEDNKGKMVKETKSLKEDGFDRFTTSATAVKKDLEDFGKKKGPNFVYARIPGWNGLVNTKTGELYSSFRTGSGKSVKVSISKKPTNLPKVVKKLKDKGILK